MHQHFLNHGFNELGINIMKSRDGEDINEIIRVIKAHSRGLNKKLKMEALQTL